MRAFTNRNFIFYDKDGAILSAPFERPRVNIDGLGTLYDVQKNRMNNQIIKFICVIDYPTYCPVESGLNIKTRANVLGKTGPEDPLCVYEGKNGIILYLTGTDMTDYFRLILRLVMPNISNEELKLISTHSIRVFACVLLHEAGKDGPFIKLRLRWLSNCFEVYLRNTETINSQHAFALNDIHLRMANIAISSANLNEVVFIVGIEDIQMPELEDED